MTESFENVMAEMRKVITDDCDQTYCAMYDDDCYACEGAVLDHLQRAHDHEIEQLRRLRFREGYEAGQRSMDAEHYAVALRLKHLPLDEDSHGNLSQIARAVWHSDFGWTRGACDALRDELVRLLGGVHDEPAPIPASRCACDADCNCHNQQPQAVAYDVLGNERHKAVCELRKMPDCYTHDGKRPPAGKFNEALSDAIGVTGLPSFAKIRDRLIHLLGGDECNFSGVESYMDGMGEKSNPAEISGASTDHVILDTPLPNSSELLPNFSEPNLPKSAEIAKPESDDGGEVTITDELRKFATDPLLGYASQELHVERITAIADRIDEMERKLRKQRDGFRRGMVAAQDLLEKRTDERDELRKSLREIAERAGAPHDVDLDEYSDDLVAKATLGKIDSTHEYIGALEWQRDRQRKLLDKYENADTPEEIVRDIHLGIATDSQAIERIRALS